MSAYFGGNEWKWWLQNPDLVVNNPILNLKYLTASSQELHVCFSSQIVSDAYNSNTSYLKLLAIDRIFCYNWNIITAFRYISKQKMISLNTCEYYNELQKIYNDLDNFFYNSEEKWHPGLYLWICPSKRPSVNNENSYVLDTRRQRKRGRPRTSWKGQWRASLKLCNIPGDQSQSWPRIDRAWGSFFAALHTMECNGQWWFVCIACISFMVMIYALSMTL